MGNTAIYFDGTNDRINFTSPAWAFGTGDFTLEYWAYWNSHSGGTGYYTLFSTRRTSGGFSVGTDSSSDMVWYDTNGTSSRKLEVVGAVPLQQWTHQAFSRINGIMYGWQDGVLKGKGTVSANYTTTES